jgi:hypothetical protein
VLFGLRYLVGLPQQTRSRSPILEQTSIELELFLLAILEELDLALTLDELGVFLILEELDVALVLEELLMLEELLEVEDVFLELLELVLLSLADDALLLEDFFVVVEVLLLEELFFVLTLLDVVTSSSLDAFVEDSPQADRAKKTAVQNRPYNSFFIYTPLKKYGKCLSFIIYFNF